MTYGHTVGPLRGKTSGNQHDIYLAPGEHITQIEGYITKNNYYYATLMARLKLTSSAGQVYGPYGNPPSWQSIVTGRFLFQGSQLVRLAGKEGKKPAQFYIHNVKFIFAC